jgi:hypothetical protein
LEKNPTIVNSPNRGLQMESYLHDETSSALRKAQSEVPNVGSLSHKSVKELKALAARGGAKHRAAAISVLTKEEVSCVACLAFDCVIQPNVLPCTQLVAAAKAAIAPRLASISTRYDLLANICHDSPPERGRDAGAAAKAAKAEASGGDGTYRVQVKSDATEQWFQIQDLLVDETDPHAISLSQSYLMVYKRVPPAGPLKSGDGASAVGGAGGRAAAGVDATETSTAEDDAME